MGVRATGKDSAELSYSSNTYIDAGLNIRPLRDHIIVEPLPVDHSKVLEVIEHTKALRGIVKAVGPGHYPNKYDHPDKHKRTKMWKSKVFRKTEIKVGDIVELGGYGLDDRGGMHKGYNFQQFVWAGKIHIACREADVVGISEKQHEMA
jgi:co-chaperonin GroES (HSP10)